MIKNKVQSKVAQAFNKKLGDAVSAFTCSKEIRSGEFDFETETYPTTIVEAYSGRGVLFGSYAKDLVKPDDYQVTDCKATVLQNEVTQVPQIGDVWVTVKGSFKVLDVGDDPVGATYSIQLRKV